MDKDTKSTDKIWTDKKYDRRQALLIFTQYNNSTSMAQASRVLHRMQRHRSGPDSTKEKGDAVHAAKQQ